MCTYFVIKADECLTLSFHTTLGAIFVGFPWSLNANFNAFDSLQLANKCVVQGSGELDNNFFYPH